jgi:hypothetical protein
MQELIFKFETEILRLKWQTALIDLETAVRRCHLAQQKANFNTAQPRVPAGSGRESGRWTDGGSFPASLGDGIQAYAQAPRGFMPGKHHFVPQAVYKKYPLRPETRKVFEDDTTAPLRAERHGWSKEHRIYNDAVDEDFKRNLRELGIPSEEMTPEQAQKFLDRVKRSADPRIRDYNLRIYRREILYWIRRMPRRE